MFYGAMVWDPWLIVSQIVCLQCLYYLSLGLFMWILVGSHVPRLTLLYFFDFSMLSASTVTGWCVLAAFFFSALAGAGYMFFLIERARKCLDFAATLYIIHLFLCLIYGGWPSTVTWWVSNGVGLAAMALLGEWLCRRRELRDIPIGTRTTMETGHRQLHCGSEMVLVLLQWLCLVNGVGPAAMALLGEWCCGRRELRDIPIRTRTSV